MDTTEIKHPFPTVAALDADPAAGGTPDKFPLWAFPPQIREVSEDLARVYQIPVCLATMSGLGALSGAVGKWAEVRGAYRDKATRTNLYIIAGAERGTGKGNTSKLADPIRLRESIMQGENRERFARELHRLRGYRFKRLLIIGAVADIEAGSYRSAIAPASVLATLAAIEARYDVPVVFAPDPAAAALQIESWAAWYAREMLNTAKAIEGEALKAAEAEPLQDSQ